MKKIICICVFFFLAGVWCGNRTKRIRLELFDARTGRVYEERIGFFVRVIIFRSGKGWEVQSR